MTPKRMKVRQTIELTLRDGAHFLELYFNDGDIGGVTVPVSAQLAVGDRCELDIAFPRENLVFHTRGEARWRRMRAQKGLPAGIGIRFADTERRTRDLLLEHADGRKVTLVERATQRFPVEIEVRYKTDSVFVTDVTDDFSLGGCFICTETLTDIGEVIKVKLRPPGFFMGITVKAEVVWLQTRHRRGIGVRFVDVGGRVRRKLDELIVQVRERAADAGSML